VREYKAKLMKVVDGDTIDARIYLGFQISIIKRIRLSNIDTPELRSSNINERQKAIAAKERLQELMYRDEGFFKLISEGFDKYGRCIGQVIVEGENISKTLIKEGYGVPYFKD